MKKNLSLFLICLLIFCCFTVSGAEVYPPEVSGDIVFSIPDFSGISPSESGYIRNHVKYYANDIGNAGMFSANDMLPAKYNCDVNNIKGPGIMDQGDNGTCWAVSATAVLDNYMMLKNPSVNYDYSEIHMAHSMTYKTNSGSKPNTWGMDWGFENGGNTNFVMAYYSRGSGPVLEKNDPYPAIPQGSTRPGAVVPRAADITHSKQVEKYISDMYVLPNITSYNINDADPGDAARLAQSTKIKKLVMEHGAAVQGLYVNQLSTDSYYNMNTGKTAFYTPKEWDVGPNHQVYIIGWDDTYSASDFLTSGGKAPSGNGAFLIANSWGVNSGQKGYYWLSYYDKYIGDDCMVISGVKEQSEYDKLYQYDELGIVSEISFGGGNKKVCLTNVFHDATSGEKLKAVSFNTVMENLSYKIYFNNGGLSKSIELLAQGIAENVGFHTVDVPERLINGSDFTIVVEFESENWIFVPVTGRVPGYSSQHSSELNESYAYVYSYADYPYSALTFEDYSARADLKIIGAPYDMNACIKAHTNMEASKAKFRNANDEIIEGLQPGELNVNIKLSDDTVEEPYAAFALMDGNRLVKLYYLPISYGNNTFKLDIPSGGNYKLNTMIFDNENLRPVLKEKDVLE